MNFQKILPFIIILIFIVIIMFQFGLRHSRFFFGLYSKLKKKQYKQNNYFKGNFEKIFKKYYHSEINSKDKNKLINCSRNVKNQYALLDKSISRDILPEIKSSNNNNPEIIMKLLKRIIKFVHLNGKAINLNDCFVIDCLRSKDIIFPFFHTDVEWNSFCENNGFQVWMLLKAGKQENKVICLLWRHHMVVQVKLNFLKKVSPCVKMEMKLKYNKKF